MTAVLTERDAMLRALALAATPGVPLGPNPRVGCVLLADDGSVIATGYHRGAGSAHAEADALAKVGAARGATAVVTLEPCNHTGRTGPCAQALIEAGVRRVVFAQPDPNPIATSGSDRLRAAGVEVESGLLLAEATAVNRAWSFGVTAGRPFVTWKSAATLDGYSAAVDGTSQWITGRSSRADAHRLRAIADTVLVGTGTVVFDDPALTVRGPDGRPSAHQPLRAVMGERDLDTGHRIFDSSARTVLLPTRDPQVALDRLFELGQRHVLLEGGPTLAAAFLRAGLVDEIVAYIAPVLLGSGTPVVGTLGIATIRDAVRADVSDVTVLTPASGEQPDVRYTMTPRAVPSTPAGLSTDIVAGRRDPTVRS